MRNFQLPGRSSVYAGNCMCATSHPIAANAAIDILRQGGNAMDSAIGAALLLGLCEPQMAGLGGDCFILFSPAGTNEVKSLNGSGHSPKNASADFLRELGNNVVPVTSPHAVTIPGALGAFHKLSEEWGILGLEKILQPAIHYADSGIPVAPRVALDWQNEMSRLQGNSRKHYLIKGKAPRPGQIFRAPGQAEVLRRVAKHGAKAFYEGEVAEDILHTLRTNGGVHHEDDFASEKPTYSEPISGIYKDLEILEHSPNSQGIIAILMLNMLKHFNLSNLDPLGYKRIHIETEITKIAYNIRNRLIADPEIFNLTDHLINAKTAEKLANLISLNSVLSSVSKINEAVHKDTVYITVVDSDRMAVSLIYSIFHAFGSGLSSEKFGILLQNRGAGFNLERNHPNEYAGRKRPLHTIIPGIIRKKKKVEIPFGVMGGQYQPLGHMRFISNIVDFGMDLQTAIDFPRAFQSFKFLELESGYDQKVIFNLKRLGHNVRRTEIPFGGAQAIKIHESGILEGGSDPRKDGCAIGY